MPFGSDVCLVHHCLWYCFRYYADIVGLVPLGLVC